MDAKQSDLRVSTRLSIGFGAVLLLMIMLSALAIFSLVRLGDDLDHVVNDNNVRLEQANTMRDAVNDMGRELSNLVLLTEEQEIRAHEAQIDKAALAYRQAFSTLKNMPSDRETDALLALLEQTSQAALALKSKVLELEKSGQNIVAFEILTSQTTPAMAKWDQQLEELLIFEKKSNRIIFESNRERKQGFLGVLVGGNVLGIVLTLLVGTLVARSILRQLGGEPHVASALARAIAAGDLNVQIQLRPGDTSSMLAQFKIMAHSLSAVVKQVREAAHDVADISQEIANGNHNLGQRTEEQASALEQTAASMEQLGSTARLNADNVRQANQLASTATQVATKGGQVVGQVVNTMRGINASSQKIGDIINVIDGIAFQTNILALNAAVEAARAGEQGRGFAVVAGEVRVLSQRTAEAAKEVKQLITASVEQVKQGNVLVDQAGHTITDVVTAVKRVTDLMNEINVAINEQSTNIAQVSDAVVQMDKVTQQNAALVEEATAATEGLKNQARHMVDTVAVFKLV